MPEPSSTLTEQAYQALKQKILRCDMLPGEPVFEKQLANELQCGRTPVREALLSLKNEKLIEVYPRKGMCVAPLTQEYINEIYQLRKLLEPTVCVKYKQIFDKPALIAYEERFQSQDLSNNPLYFSLDTEFHQFLISVTKNHTLMEFYSGLMQVQYRIGMYSIYKRTAIKETSYQEHAQIIHAILNESDTEIEQAITEHINRSLITALRCTKE